MTSVPKLFLNVYGTSFSNHLNGVREAYDALKKPEKDEQDIAKVALTAIKIFATLSLIASTWKVSQAFKRDSVRSFVVGSIYFGIGVDLLRMTNNLQNRYDKDFLHHAKSEIEQQFDNIFKPEQKKTIETMVQDPRLQNILLCALQGTFAGSGIYYLDSVIK